jgi:hypothetical protein
MDGLFIVTGLTEDERSWVKARRKGKDKGGNEKRVKHRAQDRPMRRRVPPRSNGAMDGHRLSRSHRRGGKEGPVMTWSRRELGEMRESQSHLLHWFSPTTLF